VKDASVKKQIVVEDTLTMSSGLVDPDDSFFVAAAKPQNSLAEVLNRVSREAQSSSRPMQCFNSGALCSWCE
jgi:CubicO group peptidase (beta-lactamase class C family)